MPKNMILIKFPVAVPLQTFRPLCSRKFGNLQPVAAPSNSLKRLEGIKELFMKCMARHKQTIQMPKHAALSEEFVQVAKLLGHFRLASLRTKWPLRK